MAAIRRSVSATRSRPKVYILDKRRQRGWTLGALRYRGQSGAGILEDLLNRMCRAINLLEERGQRAKASAVGNVL
jgi:hypothetical protein